MCVQSHPTTWVCIHRAGPATRGASSIHCGSAPQWTWWGTSQLEVKKQLKQKTTVPPPATPVWRILWLSRTCLNAGAARLQGKGRSRRWQGGEEKGLGMVPGRHICLPADTSRARADSCSQELTGLPCWLWPTSHLHMHPGTFQRLAHEQRRQVAVLAAARVLGDPASIPYFRPTSCGHPLSV